MSPTRVSRWVSSGLAQDARNPPAIAWSKCCPSTRPGWRNCNVPSFGFPLLAEFVPPRSLRTIYLEAAGDGSRPSMADRILGIRLKI